MTKKLLIAVDISKEGKFVLEQGLHLANTLNADYSVLTVVEPFKIVYADVGVLADKFVTSREDMKSYTTKSLFDMTESISIPSDKVMVEEGNAVDTILSVAEENGFDLIVLGSHGKSGLKLLLGSTANGVLHRAKCNVLSIRVFDK